MHDSARPAGRNVPIATFDELRRHSPGYGCQECWRDRLRWLTCGDLPPRAVATDVGDSVDRPSDHSTPDIQQGDRELVLGRPLSSQKDKPQASPIGQNWDRVRGSEIESILVSYPTASNAVASADTAPSARAMTRVRSPIRPRQHETTLEPPTPDHQPALSTVAIDER